MPVDKALLALAEWSKDRCSRMNQHCQCTEFQRNDQRFLFPTLRMPEFGVDEGREMFHYLRYFKFPQKMAMLDYLVGLMGKSWGTLCSTESVLRGPPPWQRVL